MSYVYLGGPITGLTFDEATDWREKLELPEGWEPLSPMRDKEQFRVEGPLPSTFDEGSDAVAQDLDDIRLMDVGLWNFLGAERASVGSCCEIGYAYAIGKPIVIVQEPAGEDRTGFAEVTGVFDGAGHWEIRQVPYTAPPNPHDHIFIHEFATFECHTLDDAMSWLASFRRRNSVEGYADFVLRNS